MILIINTEPVTDVCKKREEKRVSHDDEGIIV